MRVAVEDLGSPSPEPEIHHLQASNIVIGRAPSADLVLLDGQGIGRRHTRVLARRGFLVIVDLGSRRGTQVRDELIRAPVVLAPGQSFFIDRFRFRAWPSDELSPRPRDRVESSHGATHTLGEETASDFSDVRWFTRHDGEHLEQWTVPARAFEPSSLDAWLRRVTQTSEQASAYLPEILALGTVRGRPGFKERLPVHVTLEQIDAAIDEGRFQPSATFTYSLAAQILEAVSVFHERHGPHGALVPRAFVLGLDGRLILRRPGPMPGDLDLEWHRDYLSPARKCGGPPSFMDDRFSLAALGWLGRLIPAGSLAETPLADIARGLHEGAVEAGLDPSSGQLAHIARLVYRRSPRLLRNNRPLT